MCSVMVVPRSLRSPAVMVKAMPSSLSQRTGSAPSRKDSVSMVTLSETMNTE